jgi:hypothetical protein
MLYQDMEMPETPFELFQTFNYQSHGSYSGAVPNEKIT